ncbi:MAG: hypothetical protein J6K15_06300 [Lachnospiraceae bacterium]|nr:hypothetical protein [Lachnospiraceae bacterium]
MLEFLTKLNLQLFADGGDGGSAGEGTAGSTTGENDIPAGIPDRAKKYYKKAVEKTTPPEAQTTSEQNVTEDNPVKRTYADLIKSEEYKDEHQAYMEKTIGERLKHYKGIEEQNGKMHSLLEIVGSKYNLDAASENFLDDLSKRVAEDNSYYEKYAMEHDIPAEVAKKVITLENQVRYHEQQRQEQQRQEATRQHMLVLNKNAEKTKAQFPDFDMEKEMQDERFRRLCMVNNGDTTAAYIACHYSEIVPNTVRNVSQQIASQTAQAVAANRARPVENGLSGTAPSVATVTQDFKNMSLKELRAYADEQRRKAQGR